MEDTLQTSAIEKDDSFSILYSSLDSTNRNTMDEFTAVGMLVDKLAEVRTKYETMAQSLSDQLDIIETERAAEKIANKADFDAKLQHLQDMIQMQTEQLENEKAEKNAVNNFNFGLKNLVVLIRDQIDDFFDQINHGNQNAAEEVVDVVNIESDTEDAQSDHGHDNEEMEQEQSQVTESNANNVDVVQSINEQEPHETEQIGQTEQNVSNGEAHGETFQTNDDDGKENVRPQSTPIAKTEAPIVQTAAAMSSTTSIATVPNVDVAPKPPMVETKTTNEPGISVIVPQKKHYACIFCEKVFSKKSLVFEHWKIDHQKRVKKAVEIDANGARKRKRLMIKADADDDDDEVENDENDEIMSNNGFYVSAHSNPMKQAMKRHKKSGTKFIYMTRN